MTSWAITRSQHCDFLFQEKSLVTQLKDLKEYLVKKIETRFMELQKEVQKAVQVKKKAIDNRRKFLDRNFLQVIDWLG